MHIVVCAKRIPDPEVSAIIFRVDVECRRRARVDGLQMVMSPYDEQCFEAAMRIQDELGEDVRVTALCLGDNDDDLKLFKRAFSWNVESGYYLSDPAFEGGDGFTTARTLATAINNLGDVDLMLVGRQAADKDEGLVGYALARELDIPLFPCAAAVQLEGRNVVVERVLDDGSECIEATLPAVVSVSNELGEPRRPSMRQVMQAGRKKPTRMGCRGAGHRAGFGRHRRCATSRRETLCPRERAGM